MRQGRRRRPHRVDCLAAYTLQCITAIVCGRTGGGSTFDGSHAPSLLGLGRVRKGGKPRRRERQGKETAGWGTPPRWMNVCQTRVADWAGFITGRHTKAGGQGPLPIRCHLVVETSFFDLPPCSLPPPPTPDGRRAESQRHNDATRDGPSNVAPFLRSRRLLAVV